MYAVDSKATVLEELTNIVCASSTFSCCVYCLYFHRGNVCLEVREQLQYIFDIQDYVAMATLGLDKESELEYQQLLRWSQ